MSIFPFYNNALSRISSQPTLQGGLTYNEDLNDDGGDFWNSVKNVAGILGRGLAAGAGALAYGALNNIGSARPYQSSSQFEQDYQAIQNMAARPIQPLGAYQPLGEFEIPDVYQPQPRQRRMTVQPYQGMDWNQPPQVTRQQRLTSIGHVMQQNNPNNRFNQNHSRGKFESGMMHQEPQTSLIRNISRGISSFISPGTYGASRSNNSIRQTAQAQLNEFQQQQAMRKAQKEQSAQERLIEQQLRQNLNIKPHRMPNMIQPGNKKDPLIQQFEQGVPFTLKGDWQNFVHKMRLEYYDRLRHQGQSVADRFEEQIIEKAIENLTGPHALRHKDGYIVIGNKAYGTTEAQEKAEDFIEHLLEHDTYPPLKYPTKPNLPKDQYPDVTVPFNNILENITKDISHHFYTNGRVGVYLYIKDTFSNNSQNDLQVNHELPGQVVSNNTVTLDKNNNVITIDQYALFNGRIERAGYLSNYTYGYAGASGGLRLDVLEAVPQIKNDKQDNPKDLEAIRDGFNQFKQSFPEEPQGQIITLKDLLKAKTALMEEVRKNQ